MCPEGRARLTALPTTASSERWHVVPLLCCCPLSRSRPSPLTGSMFRVSGCAPTFSWGSVSRPDGLGAAVGPWAAASSCCCGASSCAFLTSEPGPVSVVMTAGHRAGHRTRGRDKNCHRGGGLLPWQPRLRCPGYSGRLGQARITGLPHTDPLPGPATCPCTDPLPESDSLSTDKCTARAQMPVHHRSTARLPVCAKRWLCKG